MFVLSSPDSLLRYTGKRETLAEFTMVLEDLRILNKHGSFIPSSHKELTRLFQPSNRLYLPAAAHTHQYTEALISHTRACWAEQIPISVLLASRGLLSMFTVNTQAQAVPRWVGGSEICLFQKCGTFGLNRKLQLLHCSGL